jgi:hypothetical protein
MNASPQATRYQTLPRRAHALALAGAAIATMGTIGAIAMLVERATATPWLPAEQAGLVAHCDSMTASTERRACVQAAVAWRDQVRMAAARQ